MNYKKYYKIDEEKFNTLTDVEKISLSSILLREWNNEKNYLSNKVSIKNDIINFKISINILDNTDLKEFKLLNNKITDLEEKILLLKLEN